MDDHGTLTEFSVNEEFKYIKVNLMMEATKFEEIWIWCYNNGNYIMSNNVLHYQHDTDLTEFLLRWA